MKSMMLEYIDVLQRIEAFLEKRKVLRLPAEKTQGESCYFEALNDKQEILREDETDASALLVPSDVMSTNLRSKAAEHRLQVSVNQARADLSSSLAWDTNKKMRDPVDAKLEFTAQNTVVQFSKARSTVYASQGIDEGSLGWKVTVLVGPTIGYVGVGCRDKLGTYESFHDKSTCVGLNVFQETDRDAGKLGTVAPDTEITIRLDIDKGKIMYTTMSGSREADFDTKNLDPGFQFSPAIDSTGNGRFKIEKVRGTGGGSDGLHGMSVADLERMADSVRDIIKIFGENTGTALIDEVDMILHPLRSELNFPILEKFDADLKPERWLLPLFLLEAVFYATPNGNRSLSLDNGWKYRKAHTVSASVLSTLVLAFQRGVKQLLVQDSPHLVVLHADFYEHKLKASFTLWSMIFFVPWMREEIDIVEPPERQEYPTLHAAWFELKKIEAISGKKQIQTQLTEFISGATHSLDIGLEKGSPTAKLVCMCVLSCSPPPPIHRCRDHHYSYPYQA